MIAEKRGIPPAAHTTPAAGTDVGVIRFRARRIRHIHWRQVVVLTEIFLLFALGAGVGGLCVPVLGVRTIWLSCSLLLVSFCLMLVEAEETSRPEP